ncbi:MAG: hypothetical protein AAF997_22125 [Myxococcota bacterium]
MEELLKDSLGTIAVLIYILYPIFKRWLDRRRQKKTKTEQTASPREQASTPDASPQDAPSTAAGPLPPPSTATPESPEDRLLPRLERQADGIADRAQKLLSEAKAHPRLVRLVPALERDLLARVRAIQVSLRSRPTMDTLLRDTRTLNGLVELLGYLERIARQRMQRSPAALGDADRMADACYAPMLDFAKAQGLDLQTSTPIVVTGDWQLSIIPRFASTRIAPLRVPRGFSQSIWLWPALAHEVAHDLYYSVDGLEDDLHRRLDLPHDVATPTDEQDVNRSLLRGLFGAWLSEVFADTIGTLTLGPAYVETMRHAFRDPDAAHQTGAIFQSQGFIDEHPPARLRVYMAARVLRKLGRHDEADSIWSRWQADHEGVDLYFLPLGGRWVGLNEDTLHATADTVVDALLDEPWPELNEFALTKIPGFAYLHAEHAETRRVMAALQKGDARGEEVRWIMAAAVLLVAQDPNRHEDILAVAQQAIVGVGAETLPVSVLPKRAARSIAGSLKGSLRNPSAITEAIVLGAAIRPYRRPKWR